MESLPLPDEELLKILYELSIDELNNMAQTNSHFRDLIAAPDFWDRKGQHMTRSATIPINPNTGHPFYGARSWKEYILTIEGIFHQVDDLIKRLRVMEEPEYRLNPDGTPDEDDLMERSPTLFIYPSIRGTYQEIIISKQQGNILLVRDDEGSYLYFPNATAEQKLLFQEEHRNLRTALVKMGVSRIELASGHSKQLEFKYFSM